MEGAELERRIEDDDWVCPICNRICASSQGFGNHMSRTHGIVNASKMELVCEECGKVFFRGAARVNGENHFYCSKECFGRAERGKNHPMYGRHHSNEAKRKISEANKGHRHTNETKRKISEATSGKNHYRWQGGKVTLVCEECGRKYLVKACRVETSHFCSIECLGKSKRGGGSSIERICKVCGRTFFVRPSHAKNGQGRFCSLRCRGIGTSGSNSPTWKGGPVKCTCEVCGDIFYRNQDSIERGGGRFCSDECRIIGMSGSNAPNWNGGPAKRICEVCGDVFYTRKSQVKKGGGRFCSNKCRGIGMTGSNNYRWKGGYKPYYGPHWPHYRALARNRDQFTCQRCGTPELKLDRELDVHHIIPFYTSYNNDLSNLISLCPSCHHYCEWHPEECPSPRIHWLLSA